MGRKIKFKERRIQLIMVKYTCEKCNYETDDKYKYSRHLKTKKHRGDNSHRSDRQYPDKCPMCDYVAKKGQGMAYKEHVLNQHSTEKERKEQFNYYCDLCDFGTFGKCVYKSHLETKIHQQIVKVVNREVAKALKQSQEDLEFKPTFSNKPFGGQ